MRRAIAAVLGGILLAIWLQGCTSAALGPLDVTPALRQACTGAVDQEIQIIITVVEDAKAKGTLEKTTLNTFANACAGDTATEAACLTCTVAIIDQVYGK
jgi:hypothetical protein